MAASHSNQHQTAGMEHIQTSSDESECAFVLSTYMSYHYNKIGGIAATLALPPKAVASFPAESSRRAQQDSYPLPAQRMLI